MPAVEAKRKFIPSLPKELRWFLSISAIAALCSIAYVLYSFVCVHTEHHNLPFDIYTKYPFEDLTAFVVKIGMLHQPEFFTTEWKYFYPAPCVFIYYFFSIFSRTHFKHPGLGSDLAYCIVVVGCLIFLGRQFTAALVRRGLISRQAKLFVLASACLSWPILYAIHQGNIEAILWIGVAMAIWAYREERWWTAAVLIAIFGSFKIYPMLFLALFLAPKKYAQIAVSVLLFVAISIGSLLFIGPSLSVAYAHVSAGVAAFSAIGLSLAGSSETTKAFDHSFCGLLHFVFRNHPTALVMVLRQYMKTIAVAMVILFFARIWKMPRLNQVLFITLATVSLPPLSYDYTLELLYIPWAWLVILTIASNLEGRRISGLLPIMIGLALLTSPQLFLRWHGLIANGPLKASVILVLFYLVARYPLGERSEHPGAEPLSVR